MKRLLHLAVFILALGLIPGVGGMEFLPPAYAAGCVARENLEEKAGLFIIRCRRASINREFPSELLKETLGTIQRGNSAVTRRPGNSSTTAGSPSSLRAVGP